MSCFSDTFKFIMLKNLEPTLKLNQRQYWILFMVMLEIMYPKIANKIFEKIVRFLQLFVAI